MSVGAFEDTDRDLHGDPDAPTMVCPGAVAASPVDDDCDDENRAVHGSQVEICDGFDNDCDGAIDEETRAVTWYRDADGDGFGSAGSGTVVACDPPDGYSLLPTDCDDDDMAISPLATELCNGRDDNCNGRADFPVGPGDFEDDDGDGVVDPACGMGAADCDDRDPATRPGATELCDLKDNDCNGVVDDGSAMGMWYLDADGDGYGTDAGAMTSCAPIEGRIPRGGDCNDGDITIHPGEVDGCNGVNDDCDAGIDEDAPRRAFYPDDDMDGFGSSTAVTLACARPAGTVDAPADCNDSSAISFPGATERCNSLDDDCDGMVDEGVTGPRTIYRDADGDTYGDDSMTMSTCADVPGYVDRGGDCDDSMAGRNPGAAEICNGLDDDCDLMPDDGAGMPFYLDGDGDGYGLMTSTRIACTLPAGYATMAGDCDDTRAAVRPGATEVCNALDDDCDGMADEGFVMTTYYRDLDGDGYGNPSATRIACTMPAGYVASAGDCDDDSASVYPTAPEVCDLADNDCDSLTDEGVTRTFYRDADMDGYGDAADTRTGCVPSGGYIVDGTDCDDTAMSVNPGATETCNSVDDDCDGMTDEGVRLTYYADLDMDGYGNPASSRLACTMPVGYVANNTDCDDLVMTTHPGATETCNGTDDDCDTMVDDGALLTFYRDADMDGYGVTAMTMMACAAPGGYVAMGGDCDDANNLRYPGRAEACNGIDDDCDTMVDDGATATCTGGRVCQYGICDGIEQMEGGDQFNCVRLTSGRVKCWGANNQGQIGDGTTTRRAAPTQVTLAGPPIVTLDDAVDITLGDTHGCAIRAGGSVFCWGANSSGETGSGFTGGTRLRAVPVIDDAFTPLTNAVALGAGERHTCAIRMDGSIVCWGRNGFGQLGITAGADQPYFTTPVPGLTDAVQVTGGASFTCARRSGGGVRCWGSDASGQLGDGATASTGPTPVTVLDTDGATPLANVLDIAASTGTLCATRTGARAVCWGEGYGGARGDGTVGSSGRTYAQLVGHPAFGLRIFAGSQHFGMTDAMGHAIMWGWDNEGEMADGVPGSGGPVGDGIPDPAFIDGTGTQLVGATEGVGGSFHVCVISSPVTVRCWGGNTNGQTGDGTTVSPRLYPVNALGLP